MKLEMRFSGFEQKLLVNQQHFLAKIYEGEGLPTEDFNVLCIALDASERSLLNWQNSILLARQAVQKGLLILWEMEFDLLAGSLEDEARFLTFQLNIQHFTDTLWKEFQHQTLGVALFRGQLQGGVLDYLKSLAASLDEETSCFLFLDTSSAGDLESYLQHVPLESLGGFLPILKGKFMEKFPWAFPALAWEHSSSHLGFCGVRRQPILMKQMPLKYALCLPEHPCWRQMQKAIDQLGVEAFRIIPENLLTQEWEGIDNLIIFPETVTDKTMRKLRGFLAAGGQIIEFPNVAASLLPRETSLNACPAFLQ